MSFTNANWTCISGSLSQGQELVAGIILNAPNLFTYASPIDTVATISATNYFLPKYTNISLGDIILGSGSDSSFGLIVTASNITTVTVTPIFGDGTGSVTSITAGNGLTGGVITTSGTIGLSVPVSGANGGTGVINTGSLATLPSGATTLVPTTGAGAAGTWGISISGNAATATSATSSTTAGAISGISASSLYGNPTGILANGQSITLGTNLSFSGTTLNAAGSSVTPAALTETNDTNVTLTLGGTPATALLQAVSMTLGWSGILSIARGGTAVSSVTTSPTATAFAGWDANKNLSANSFIPGYTTTATAAGTTTLVVGSAYQQYFTGTTTQTVLMPVTSTLVLGQPYLIVNNSTGIVTVQSSGANIIQAMAAGTQISLTVISTSLTTAAAWNFSYGSLVSSSSPWTAGTGTGSAKGGDGSALASGNFSIAYGSASPVASGLASFAFGTTAVAQSAFAIAIGHGATAGSGANTGSVAIGSSASASLTDSFAIGRSSVSTNTSSFAIGTDASSSGVQAMALGFDARTPADGSMMLADGSGLGNATTIANQILMQFGGGYYLQVGNTLVVQVDTAFNLINKKGTADQSYSVQTPTTGFSITVGAGVKTLTLVPAGTLATGTIIMPAAPIDGQEIRVSSTQQITALTVSANAGQTISNAPTILNAGAGFEYIYNLANTVWLPLYQKISLSPQVTVLASGTGTYTSPVGSLYLEVELIGGGGGGGGTGTSGQTTGGTGGITTFGTSLLTGNGGVGGNGATAAPGTGGTATGGDVNLTSPGMEGSFSGLVGIDGGNGGSTIFGGIGSAGNGNATSGSGVTNTGSGGGGGSGGTAFVGGGGGGSGGYVRKLLVSPLATYAYGVGAAGAIGAAGVTGQAGGAGGSGIIIITAKFQ